MMDLFDEKRGMIKQLLNMLKTHASNEVDSGLKKPEGEGDMHGVQAEKVEVLPEHEMDKATPEHEVETKLVEDGEHTANAGYDKGGYVDAPAKPIPYESAEGHPDKEGSAHEEATESEAEREQEGDIQPTTMFESFLSRKRKK
jgi:hypothetical protein